MRLYPENATEKFEFETVREWLIENCISPMGKEIAKNLHPYTSFKNIKGHLALTWELKLLLENYTNFPIDGYYYVSSFLHLLEKDGYTAQIEQLMTVRSITKAIDNLRKYLKEKEDDDVFLLRKLVNKVEFEKKIITEIDKVLTNEGSVKNRASTILMVIRDEQIKARRELEREFSQALNKYKRAGYLADIQESLRHGRRVLAVKSEYKRKVSGIIHDISETGQTAYIEPNGALQWSNEIINLEQEERAEIHRILKKLTADVRPFLHLVYDYENLLGKIDFTRAKAKIATMLDAKVPEIVDYPVIKLKDAYHPILKAQNDKIQKRTNPLNLELSKESRIIVISGPNAGGKSVALKTVGLLQMMLQSGLLVPVDESSVMGTFQQFFSEIGDDQSIENELSTYSSKLKHMGEFLKYIDKNSVFLIDEFGSGTDPSLGGAVAQSILEELHKRKAFGIVTTHYLNLKTYAGDTKGIENGAMLFNETTLKPLYQLEVGKPGSSYTFAIAQTSGLPKTVINRAKSISNKDQVKLDELLTNTQQSQSDILIQRLELENRIKELETKENELKQVRKRLKQQQEKYQIHKNDEKIRIQSEVKRLFDEHVRKLDTVSNQQKGIQEIRESLKNELTTTKSILHQKLRQKEEKKSKKKGEKIEVGDLVKWIVNGDTGKVVTIKNNKAEVALGLLKTTIPLTDLIHANANSELTAKKKAKRSSVKVNRASESKLQKFDFEIDIRGFRYEEAERTLLDFFDRAILSNSSWVRVLHGKGSGVLKKLTKQIAQQFKAVNIKHPHPEEGGDGITIVEF